MGRPVVMHLSEGQVSNYKGARLTMNALPLAKHMLADRGHDASWFVEVLMDMELSHAIPAKKNRIETLNYDAVVYVHFALAK